MNEPKCPYWIEMETMNGFECFCHLGAYGQTRLKDELLAVGCTRQKREKCLQTMIARQGYGLVPTEIAIFPKQKDMPQTEPAAVPLRKAE